MNTLSNYELDKSIEELNTSIIEESFLKHYFGDNYTIVEDKETQKKGIDFIGNKDGKQYNIDYKTPTDYFDKANRLRTWVIEVGNIYESTLRAGWGISQLDTTHYLWVKPIANSTSNNKCYCFEIILVDKNVFISILTEYYKYVCKKMIPPEVIDAFDKDNEVPYNVSDKTRFIYNHAKFFINNTLRGYGATSISDIGKSLLPFELEGIRLKISTQKAEHPLNIVVPWVLYQRLAEKFGWYHAIYCKYDNNWNLKDSWDIDEYSDDLVVRYMDSSIGIGTGKQYINSIQQEISSKALDVPSSKCTTGIGSPQYL